MDLTFEEAIEKIKKCRPSNDTKLKLYGLYKQSKEGNCNKLKPSLRAGMVERAKWDAWNNYRGWSSDDAKKEYVKIVHFCL